MSAHPATKWDVYRDENDEPVTITQEQFQAIWHAVRTVQAVRYAEGAAPIGAHGSWHADLAKSRLLGRMLMDGRPPLDEKPPRYVAACGYHLVEPELEHWYFGSTPMLATVAETPDGLVVTKLERFPDPPAPGE